MSTPVHVTVSAYQVSVLPEDHPLHRHARVHVAGSDTTGWTAVVQGEYVQADGSLSYTAHRWPTATDALAVARMLAPVLVLNDGREAWQLAGELAEPGA